MLNVLQLLAKRLINFLSENNFIIFGFCIAILFLESIFFALWGLFYPFLILVIFSLLITLFLYFGKKIKEKNQTIKIFLDQKEKFIPQKDKNGLFNGNLFAFCLIILINIYIFIFFNPIFLGGRDPGALMEASFMLTKNHQLEFAPTSLNFLNNKDNNELALNYPGFILTKDNHLKSQFLIGNYAFLGFWVGLLGITGIAFPNLLGISIGITSFYFILKKLTKKSVFGIAGIFLLFFSFPFFWHSRSNYSEFLGFGFLFFAILLALKFYETKQNSFLLLTFLTILAFSFIRIEGIFTFIASACAIFLTSRNSISSKKKIFAFISILLIIYLLYSLSLLPFFEKIIKDFGFIAKENNTLIFKAPLSSYSLSEFFLKTSYLLRVFTLYKLELPLVFGLSGIAFLMVIFVKNKRKTKILPLIIPIFLAGPFLIYLLKPMIAMDHPWILRRFIFAIIPLLILYTIIFLSFTFKKRTAIIFSALLIIPNLNLFIEYGTIKENQNLKQNLQKLSTNFSSKDLVLVSKNIAPNSWSLLSEPLRFLENKEAVYLYNPSDIHKINSKEFKKIYLLISPSEEEKYQEFFDQTKNFQENNFIFQQLEITSFNKRDGFSEKLYLPSHIEYEKKIRIYQLKL